MRFPRIRRPPRLESEARGNGVCITHLDLVFSLEFLE